MFIQTEETPNPQSLKFILDDQKNFESGSYQFKNLESAKKKSPLAVELFKIKGVEAVYLAPEFITITKKPTIDFDEIKTEILSTIVDFFALKKSAIISDEGAQMEDSEEDDEIVKQIKELLEIKVKPAVAMDGGDVIYRGFEDGIVKLQLIGSCSGCPSSTITLKNGIENMFKHYIPEVVSVEQVFED